MTNRQKIDSLIALTVVIVGPLFVGCGSQNEKADVISLPGAYVGWVRIDYGVKGARPLPQKNGGMVYVIPSLGYLRTSTRPIQGVVYEKLQYVTGGTTTPLDGSTMMWNDGIGGPVGPNGGVLSHRTFFIGTQTQSELADQFHAGVGPIPLATFNAWTNGRNLSYQDGDRRNFANANLVGANFWSSSFKGANFQNANLSYAAMGADFTNANFKRATLRHADLTNTSLKSADLRGCALRGAQLQGTDLRGARLQNAKLAGSEYDSHTRWPRGFSARKSGSQVKAYVPVDH